MAIKGCKTIAEYAVRKWLIEQNFAIERFTLAMSGNEAVLQDENGDNLSLVYDSVTRNVSIKGN